LSQNNSNEEKNIMSYKKGSIERGKERKLKVPTKSRNKTLEAKN
jgi:hypothetical protein